MQLSRDGSYWNVNTAGIFKTSYGAKNNVVYDRHTTEKQPAETVEASLEGERSGTAPSTSMNAPAQLSESKVSGIPEENNGQPENPTVDTKGDRYYDHNLISIEKENLLNLLSQAEVNNGFGTTPDAKSTTVTERKCNNLISILQSLTDANAFRITPQQDAEYRKAYEAVDIDKAQQMQKIKESADELAQDLGINVKYVENTEDSRPSVALNTTAIESLLHLLSATRFSYAMPSALRFQKVENF